MEPSASGTRGTNVEAIRERALAAKLATFMKCHGVNASEIIKILSHDSTVTATTLVEKIDAKWASLLAPPDAATEDAQVRPDKPASFSVNYCTLDVDGLHSALLLEEDFVSMQPNHIVFNTIVTGLKEYWTAYESLIERPSLPQSLVTFRPRYGEQLP